MAEANSAADVGVSIHSFCVWQVAVVLKRQTSGARPNSTNRLRRLVCVALGSIPGEVGWR